MRIDVLCSGSKGNSVLVRDGATSLLIDCGSSSFRYLKNAFDSLEVTLDTIDALLVTHTHSDHTRQLSHFRELPVYSLAALSCKDSKKNPVSLDWHSLEGLETFSISTFRITPFVLSHDSGPTTGFVIENNREKLVYATDTGYLRQDLVPLLKGASYYVIESNHDVEMLMNSSRPWSLKQRILSDTGHLSNRDCALALCTLIDEKTKAIVLAHLSEETNTPDQALATVYEAMDTYGIDYRNIDIECASQNRILSIGDKELI